MKRSIAAAVLAGACVAASAVPASAATKVVQAKDDFFTPKSLQISKGTVVKWRFVGRSPHNVTVVTGPERFRSGNKKSGAYTRKLTKKGTYNILCTIHPGMTQTIRVR